MYSAVNKAVYQEQFALQHIPDELNTVWRFMGFHLVLAMQKHCQRESKNKGHTIFVFDNEERERLRFTDIIARPPEWSGEYYEKTKKQKALDQIVDVPYFGDSRDVALVQLADVASFFLRRYAEIKDNLVAPRYGDEETRVEGWIESLMDRSIPKACMYPKVGRCQCEDIFFRCAPPSVRSL